MRICESALISSSKEKDKHRRPTRPRDAAGDRAAIDQLFAGARRDPLSV
jgi:hypothetical protein